MIVMIKYDTIIFILFLQAVALAWVKEECKVTLLPYRSGLNYSLGNLLYQYNLHLQNQESRKSKVKSQKSEAKRQTPGADNQKDGRMNNQSVKGVSISRSILLHRCQEETAVIASCGQRAFLLALDAKTCDCPRDRWRGVG